MSFYVMLCFYPASLSNKPWLQLLTAIAAQHVQQCTELVLDFSQTIHEQDAAH